MINCVIIDDDEVSARAITQCVKRTDFLNLIAVYTNAVTAEKGLQQHPADLIFLDIEMPEMSGIELVNHMMLRPHIIFTTAKPEYALTAFNLDILDYLLKPFSYARFLKAAEKAKESIEKNKRLHASGASVFLKSTTNHVRINSEDICYLLKEGRNVKIVTSLHRHDIEIASSLKDLESKLPKENFVRINRSCIVNIGKISSVTKTSVIIKGSAILIGSQYKQQLKKYLSI